VSSATRILSFDTSTAVLYLSLHQGRELIDEAVIEPTGTHRQEAATLLLPGLASLLTKNGVSKSEIGCLVVGQGPGSFTGVRSAVVTARTLAQALKLPLIGVSRLECLGYMLERPAAVILSGPPDHFFIAAYENGGAGVMEPLVKPSYVSLNDLRSHLSGIKRWAADEAACERFEWEDRICQPLPVIKNIAAVQAEIGWNRLSLLGPDKLADSQSAATEFPWSLVEPLYLRGASVTLKKTHGDSHKTAEP
jgi:tRNA threonylcarbamoyl adenosine modification protein YeaZ